MASNINSIDNIEPISCPGVATSSIQEDNIDSRVAELAQSHITPPHEAKDEESPSSSANSERKSLVSWAVLNESQVQHMTTLLGNCHLGSEISLMTLFRVEFYNQIASLLEFLPEEKIQTLQKQLASILSNILRRHNRESLSLPLCEYTDQLFSSLESNLKDLAQFDQTLHDSLQNSDCKLKLDNILATIDCLRELIKLRNGFPLKKCIGDLEEYTAHEEVSLKQVLVFAQSCKMSIPALEKISSLFKKLTSICKKLKEIPTPEEVFSVKNCMNMRRSEFVVSQFKLAGEATEYTSKIMLQYIPVIKGIQNQNDILLKKREEKLKNSAQIEESIFLLCQFQCLFDHFISPYFPDFFLVNVNISRLLVNIKNTFQKNHALPLHKREKPNSLPRQFYNYLGELLGPIEVLCEPLLKKLEFEENYKVNGLTFSERVSQLKGYKNLPIWLATCHFFGPVAQDMISKVHKQSDRFSDQIQQFILTSVKNSPIPENKQDKMVNKLQIIYWNKMEFLQSMKMLADDFHAIMYGTNIFDQYSPLKIADYINRPDQLMTLLQGIDLEENVRRRPPRPQPVIPGIVELPQPIPSSPLAEATPPIQKKPPREKPLDPTNSKQSPADVRRHEEKIQRYADRQAAIEAEKVDSDDGKENEPVENEQSQGSHVFPVASPEILNMRKPDEVIKALNEAGFFKERQSGSHVILQDFFGRIVVVPLHDELKYGTLCSIYAQATAPIKRYRQ